MRGKYSPTVGAAYSVDQNWWTKYRDSDLSLLFSLYDPDGYDSYGYDKNDVDRAGNAEYEYYPNDCPSPHHDYNTKFDNANYDWGFDGVKPVLR